MSIVPEVAATGAYVNIEREVSIFRERSPLAARTFTSWQEWESLSADWRRILRDTAGLTIFSTPEWLGAWWKAFGQGRQFIGYSLANAGGEVIGLAPLYLDNAKERGPNGLKRLRLVGDGSGDSDNLDLIFRSGDEAACSEALLARLALEQEWDICELNTLNVDSNIARAMLSSLRSLKWPVLLSERPSSAVTLPDSWESYLRQLSREQAGGIERYTRRLGRHYEVRIVKCTKEEELLPSLEILFDLHQKRWRSQGQPGSFASAERRQFYYEMSQGFLRNGWLDLWLLELNGKAAAAQFAFRYANTAYQLQEGLDPQHYSDRAGMVLRGHILKQLISEGVRRYDFLGGLDAHKRSWGAQPEAYIDISFAKPLSRGSLHLHLKRQTRLAKGWLRTHMPAPILHALRRIG
jgi:CelD/BcsL family acetyltransferase involved in cellulose biosynthesis